MIGTVVTLGYSIENGMQAGTAFLPTIGYGIVIREVSENPKCNVTLDRTSEVQLSRQNEIVIHEGCC